MIATAGLGQRLRSLIVAGAVLSGAIWSAPARAAEAADTEPGPHRLSLGVGLEMTAPGIDRDALWAEFALNTGVAVGYAYRVLPWLELGANAVYDHSLQSSAPDVFLPALSLRGFVPVSANRATELGLTARTGLMVMGFSDYDLYWHGAAFTAAADVRHRFSAHWAGQISLELTRAGAHRTPRNAQEDYTSQSDTVYTALGLWFRVLLVP